MKNEITFLKQLHKDLKKISDITNSKDADDLIDLLNISIDKRIKDLKSDETCNDCLHKANSMIYCKLRQCSTINQKCTHYKLPF
jgi:hypothetical protein